MVRNPPIEKLLLGHHEPFAPLYDVEEIDSSGMPVRVIACGVHADVARKVIADAEARGLISP